MKKHIRKLLFVMLIFLCVNIVFDAFFFIQSNRTQKQYDAILNEYISQEEDMFRVNQLMYKLQSLTLSEILSTDEVAKKNYITQIEEITAEITELLSHYQQEQYTNEKSNTYGNLYSSFTAYLGDLSIALTMDNEGSIETAKYYVSNVMEVTLTDMNKSLDELYTLTEQEITDMKKTLALNISVTNTLLVFFVVLSVILVIIIFLFFSKFSGEIISSYAREQQEHREHVMKMQRKTIENMAELVENRDGNTGEHIKNTAFYVKLIATQLAKDSEYKDVLTDEYIELLKRYAPLHDVGKIVVPDAILLKPGRLTPQEFNEMKKHTSEGGRIIDSILADIESDEHVQIARNIVACHHEKWDGTGYPAGLSGSDIPLEARIMAVADVFDALISKRCYKEAFTVQTAYDIIEESIGTQFDPVVANAFLSLKPEIEEYLGPKKEAAC